MPHRIACAGLLPICILLAMSYTSVSNADDKAYNIEAIRSAWSLRESNTKSCVVDWEEVDFYPRDSITKSMLDVPSGVVIPEKDTEITQHLSIWFDETRMNLTLDGFAWAARTRGYIRTKSVSVFDGNESRRWTKSDGSRYIPGNVAAEQIMQESTSLSILPITMHFRPLNSVYGFNDLDHCRLDDATVPIQGIQCVRMRRARGSVEDVWYLDPQRQFAIIRAESHQKDTMLTFYDVTYYDSSIGPVPSGWKGQVNNNSGKMKYSYTSQVKKLTPNIPIDESKLSEAFPVGARVRDNTQPNESDTAHYIAFADGGKRYITNQEQNRGLSVEAILEADPGTKERGFVSRWLPWILGSLTLATAIVIIRARLRAKKL